MLKQILTYWNQELKQYSSLLSTFENELKELICKFEQGLTSLYEQVHVIIPHSRGRLSMSLKRN
jgi:hypothetical protein